MMNRRLFLVLWLGGVAAALPLIPVTVTLGETGLTAQRTTWQVATIAVLLGALLIYPVAIYAGLRIGGRLGLGAPMVAARLAGRGFEGVAVRLGTGSALGAGLGLAGVLVATVLGGSLARADPAGADIVPLWIGVAQGLSAAVGEELVFRLGLMSIVAWLAWRVRPAGDGGPSDFGMWFALGLTAVVFTMVHGAPSGEAAGTAMQVAQPMQIVRLLAGVLFGWLFWKQGLEAAMSAHFAYDIVLFYGIVLAV